MFEFYFQNGEFIDGGFNWLKDLLIPILAAVVPIGILWWQIRSERLKAKYTKKEFAETKLRYFAHLVEECLNFTEILIAELKKCTASIEENSLKVKKLGIPTDDNLTIITQKISNEEYYLAYVHHFRGRHREIGKIFSHLSSIYSTTQNVKSIWLQWIDQNNLKSKEIEEGVKNVLHELRRLEILRLVPSDRIEYIVNLHTAMAENIELDSNTDVYDFMAGSLLLPISDYIEHPRNAVFQKEFHDLTNIVAVNYTSILKLKKDNQYLQKVLSELMGYLETLYNGLRINSETLINKFGNPEP